MADCDGQHVRANPLRIQWELLAIDNPAIRVELSHTKFVVHDRRGSNICRLTERVVHLKSLTGGRPRIVRSCPYLISNLNILAWIQQKRGAGHGVKLYASHCKRRKVPSFRVYGCGG